MVSVELPWRGRDFLAPCGREHRTGKEQRDERQEERNDSDCWARQAGRDGDGGVADGPDAEWPEAGRGPGQLAGLWIAAHPGGPVRRAIAAECRRCGYRPTTILALHAEE